MSRKSKDDIEGIHLDDKTDSPTRGYRRRRACSRKYKKMRPGSPSLISSHTTRHLTTTTHPKGKSQRAGMVRRVAVIGAGPAGLVTLKYLLAAESQLGTQPLEARLFEADQGVGGTFRARTYEGTELVSSRQLTTFSDFRYKDGPDFLSAVEYVDYLKAYCSHFALWPHMRFSCRVTGLEKRDCGGHVVTYMSDDNHTDGQQKKQTEHRWECDAVAICSGLHVDLNMPHVEGIDRVPVVLHSSQFKKREQFGVGTTVMVLGSGETASDIALLAVTSPTKRVVLCHRNGFHIAPTRNPRPRFIFSRVRGSQDEERPQIPIDVSRASLFDTAYVHPWLRNSGVLWTYYDYYVRWILWTSWGTTQGSDQWIGGKAGFWRTCEIFFNKSGHKIAPYMKARWKPAQPSGLLSRLRALLVVDRAEDAPRGRAIDVAPWPARIDAAGRAHFRDNGRPEYAHMARETVRPDVVVYCTGYGQEFGFLPGGARTARRVREIWHPDDPTRAYVGFVRPNLGAIPPLAEMQAQLWVSRLDSFLSSSPSPHDPRPHHRPPPPPLLPSSEPHYRLTHRAGARVRYGVDHESYAYQLALDMGSAAGVGDVLRLAWARGGKGWRIPLTWALGANFNTKFRLVGPWRWDGAAEVMEGELWDTVARREWFFGHFTLSVVPMMIFGPMSLAVFLYASLLGFLSKLAGLCRRGSEELNAGTEDVDVRIALGSARRLGRVLSFGN
ncbi:hypothetical protein F4810DRAFT_709742 [Camillea tinctor]|nr:hypothetical protein F4810DRAFT_709742 [Camillea tinctor]